LSIRLESSTDVGTILADVLVAEKTRGVVMSGFTIDEAGSVRSGEELDLEKLRAYLAERLPEVISNDPLVVEQFPHGHSNLTYLVRQGDLELVLRRPPFGNRVKTAHDMGREYRILSRLCRIYEPAPCPVLYCDDEDVLGAPFYLMERRRGIIIRRPPVDRPIPPETVRRLCESLIDGLARLHSLDCSAAGLADLGKPDGYVERQVSGWSRRYRDARTDDLPAMERAADWLAANRPPESGAALIHNDYKFDNLVLDPADLGRIVAVLDWEMATIGDPLLDLGTTLGYWIQADDPEPIRRFLAGPTAMPGSLNRRELAERYAAAAGRQLPDLLFYYVYGLFKIAVIAQQIYARFVRGATHDPRFAALGAVVAALGESAGRAIDSSRL
jgi:aminoglycoside phosphotransferase (APT) family kinase protein